MVGSPCGIPVYLLGPKLEGAFVSGVESIPGQVYSHAVGEIITCGNF
jgi:hypothetical protein